MATPPPIQDPMNSQRWLEWFRLISIEINEISVVTWGNINFTGSNITDIVSRQHNNLQLMQGGTSGEYYHLTAAQHAALTAGPHNSLSGLQGGTATEYYHLTQTEYNNKLVWVSAPASAASTGTAGQIAYDSSYLYICTATDTWKRVAIATW